MLKVDKMMQQSGMFLAPRAGVEVVQCMTINDGNQHFNTAWAEKYQTCHLSDRRNVFGGKLKSCSASEEGYFECLLVSLIYAQVGRHYPEDS